MKRLYRELALFEKNVVHLRIITGESDERVKSFLKKLPEQHRQNLNEWLCSGRTLDEFEKTYDCTLSPSGKELFPPFNDLIRLILTIPRI